MVSIKDFDFPEETGEEGIHTYLPTNFPQPLVWGGGPYPDGRTNMRFRLIYEVYNQSIEDLYFRALDFLREENEFAEFEKILDIFAASEHSAFFGVAQQRIGLQQDKVSQFLATIGKMVKELFQLVRELRILDERMYIYDASYQADKSAEISLKGYWIDLVEGGAKNPSSVLGMAREIGFATLPDLFFDAPPMSPTDVQKHIDTLEFNRKVKEVLSRKLKSFLVWKLHTSKELKSRRTFTIKYLRQHYDIIKMYMNWVKPYLKNLRRLQLDFRKASSPHLIAAFESSLIEIEVLAKRPVGSDVYAIYHLHFDYRSRPEMKFVQEGYQRGPQHCGRTTFTVRAYAWTKDDIRRYREFRDKEDFELLGDVDVSVKAAYTSLGDELEKYLKEAESTTQTDFPKEPVHSKDKRAGLFEPFMAPFMKHGGHGHSHGDGGPKCTKCSTMNDLKTVFCKSCGKLMRKPSKAEAYAIEEAKEKAKKHCKDQWYNFQKRYKAAYGFLY
ncbi:MAG: hypothetical protein Q7R76_00830 [Candidatus Woesearchaeota archaeon]|nr:hypothetical protein [Candidatus Woesearchaeota archaeon]